MERIENGENDKHARRDVGGEAEREGGVGKTTRYDNSYKVSDGIF